MDRQQIIDGLMKPFPKSALKERVGGGGKKFTYIEGHAAIHRVLATSPDFTMRYISHWLYDDVDSKGKDRTTLNMIIGVSIPGLGEKIGHGVAVLGAGEDLAKGALTDAFKNAMKYFGQGLSLYGEDYEAPTPTTLRKQLAEALKTHNIDPSESKKKFGKDKLTDEEMQSWLEELNSKTPF